MTGVQTCALPILNQICVTCDRIAELKIDSITHICNLTHDVCYEPLHEFRNSRVHYELIEVVHSSSTASHVWNCFDVASSNSDWFYMLCRFHAWIDSSDNCCFTYICKLSCLKNVGYVHAHVWKLHIWCLHDLYHLCWVDLIPMSCDHRSSVKTLGLILNRSEERRVGKER